MMLSIQAKSYHNQFYLIIVPGHPWVIQAPMAKFQSKTIQNPHNVIFRDKNTMFSPTKLDAHTFFRYPP